MELVIPFIALGSMYMASRDSSTNTSINVVQTNTSQSSSNTANPPQPTLEGFEEDSTFSRQQLDFRQQKTPSAIMDPSNIQPNYPPANYLATDSVVVPPSTLYEYPSQSLDTNKYLNQTSYEERVNKGALPGNKLPNIYSLSGNVLSGAEFKHHNMVPFTGSKVAGPLYDDKYAENILDNMNGTGSLQFKKTEQSPLFDPSENVQYAYGAPNSSDFYQSRVNAGRSQNNTKPWESVHVGPGLDDGFSSKGIGGYNSGMEHRDKWLPKTVDELRVDTNPKMEY
jgi:hypothetical protein